MNGSQNTEHTTGACFLDLSDQQKKAKSAKHILDIINLVFDTEEKRKIAKAIYNSAIKNIFPEHTRLLVAIALTKKTERPIEWITIIDGNIVSAIGDNETLVNFDLEAATYLEDVSQPNEYSMLIRYTEEINPRIKILNPENGEKDG